MNPLRTFLTSIQRNFLTGLLVLGPAYLTIRGCGWILQQLNGMFLPPVLQWFGESARPPLLLGATATVALVTLVGLIARSVVGRTFGQLWNRLVMRVPVMRSLYALLQQFFGAVLGDQKKAFQRVVLVEYPRRGLFSYALVTGEDARLTDGPGLHLFVPSTPNPTTGYYLLAAPTEVIETDLTVDEAFRQIITAGIAQNRPSTATSP